MPLRFFQSPSPTRYVRWKEEWFYGSGRWWWRRRRWRRWRTVPVRRRRESCEGFVICPLFRALFCIPVPLGGRRGGERGCTGLPLETAVGPLRDMCGFAGLTHEEKLARGWALLNKHRARERGCYHCPVCDVVLVLVRDAVCRG